MNKKNIVGFIKRTLTLSLILVLISCSKENLIIDSGEGITLEFLDGLNDNLTYQLPRDSDGYYYLTLDGEGQTNWRISVRLSKNGEPVYSSSNGYQQKLEWSSNLYWWLLPGDVVGNITKSYFNYYTGEYTYSNLPPLVNWKEQLVPTINSSSYTDDETGIGNTVIGPIQEMLGDTMLIQVQYRHPITKQEENSSFLEVIGERILKDSVQVILK